MHGMKTCGTCATIRICIAWEFWGATGLLPCVRWQTTTREAATTTTRKTELSTGCMQGLSIPLIAPPRPQILAGQSRYPTLGQPFIRTCARWPSEHIALSSVAIRG